MYVPAAFAVDDETAWLIVDAAGAGSLTHHGEHGLQTVVTPVVVTANQTTLRAHIAKANDWWRLVNDGDEVLALFVAASSYVSPSNYPSRLEGVSHVPTWNYVAAEVRGTVTVHHDVEWLTSQTGAVTERFEAGRTPPWTVAESRPDYLAKQYGAIVGISIAVTGITGVAKLSQNRRPEDRTSVRDALANGSLNDQAVARWMTQ